MDLGGGGGTTGVQEDDSQCQRTGGRAQGRKGRGKAPPGTTLYLHQDVDREIEARRSVTVVEVARWLGSEPDPSAWDVLRIPVHVSRSTVCTWLHDLGRTQTEGGNGFVPTEQRKARVREYLRDLAKARTREKEGDVLVFMDESYLSVNHRRRISWVVTEDQHMSSNKNKGGGVIIIHAITKDGSLVADSFLDGQGLSKREGWFLELDDRRGGCSKNRASGMLTPGGRGSSSGEGGNTGSDPLSSDAGSGEGGGAGISLKTCTASSPPWRFSSIPA